MNDERKFLHDLAGPLSTLLLLIDIAIEDGGQSQRPAQDPAAVYVQTYELLERLKAMLKERREVLIQRVEK